MAGGPPLNTFETFTAIGQREDLQDTIFSIAPVETPFLSNAASTTATATLH